MKNSVFVFVATMLLVQLSADARPSRGSAQRTQTGPNAYSTQASGPRGSTVKSNSSVQPTRNGTKAAVQGEATGVKGGSASGNATVEGNQQSGATNLQGQVRGRNGGTASGQSQGNWSGDTYQGQGSYEFETPSGSTGSGQTQSTYTKGQGGSTTIQTSSGKSKTVTVPPKP